MRYNTILIFCFLFWGVCYAKKDKRQSISAVADTSKVMELLRKSKTYETNAPDIAFRFARRGLEISMQTRFTLGQARFLCEMALLNEKYHSLTQAIGFQKHALSLFLKIKNHDSELASAYLYLGIYEGKSKDRAAAINDITKALVIYERLKNTSGAFLCYINIGHIYENQGQEKYALDYYLKAKDIAKRHKLDSDYLLLLEHLGSIYFKMDSNDKALKTFQEGIDKSQNVTAHLSNHLGFLRKTGKIHLKVGDEKKAIGYYKLALQKSISNNNAQEQARSLVDLAAVLKNHNADESLSHLNKALSIAKQIGNQELAAEILHSLSEIYRQQDRFKEALLTLEAHHDLLDSLILVNKTHETEIAKGNYEIQSSRLDIQQLKITNERRTFERNASVVVIAIILLSLILLAYHFYLTRKLNLKLRVSNRVKDKLFSIIGHDLRNPIGGITTMLSLMENKDLDARTLKNVSAMKKQSEIALDILSSLLKWGQAQLKGIKVNTINFAAKPIAIKNIILLTAQANEKEIIFLNNIPDELIISADSDHFDFIIRNLLSNAIKFSYTKGVVEFNFKKNIQKNQIVFSVKDSGMGMSEEQMRKFEHGNLESNYGTNGEKGTGIGLTLCREYVKVNGGQIWVESQIERGSTFYFSLNAQKSVYQLIHKMIKYYEMNKKAFQFAERLLVGNEGFEPPTPSV